jgi:hypothetical protein
LRAYWAQFNRFRVFGKNVYRSYDDESFGRRYQYVVLAFERASVLRMMHNDPLHGHFGRDKTMAKIKERFYWPRYGKDIATYVQTCVECAKTKPPQRRIHEAYVPLLALKPLRPVSTDTLATLHTSVSAQNVSKAKRTGKQGRGRPLENDAGRVVGPVLAKDLNEESRNTQAQLAVEPKAA